MNPVTAGCLVAAAFAGPPLWSLVQEGQLDSIAAMERGAVVAGVCAIGAVFLDNVIAGFREETAKARQLARLSAALAEERSAETAGRDTAHDHTPSP
ncbi:MAG: hypothetical protein GXX79_19455 [Actinomycetales bacterium]|nr:hypothetical protein [Actinomycetales bacterium]